MVLGELLGKVRIFFSTRSCAFHLPTKPGTIRDIDRVKVSLRSLSLRSGDHDVRAKRLFVLAKRPRLLQHSVAAITDLFLIMRVEVNRFYTKSAAHEIKKLMGKL